MDNTQNLIGTSFPSLHTSEDFTSEDIKILQTSIKPYVLPTQMLEFTQVPDEDEYSQDQKRKIIATFLLLSLANQIDIVSNLSGNNPKTAEKLKSKIIKPRVSERQYEAEQKSKSTSASFHNIIQKKSSGTSDQLLPQPGMGLEKNIRQGLTENGFFDAMGKQRASQISKMQKQQKVKVSLASKAKSGLGWWIAGGMGGVFGAGALLS